MSTVIEQTFQDQVVSAFNGVDGFKVTKEGGTNFYEKNGVKLPFYQKNIGFNGTFELTLERPNYNYSYDAIVRVTSNVDIDKPRFAKKFAEQANYRINKSLFEQITKQSLVRSENKIAKAFKQWKTENERYTQHKSIGCVEQSTEWVKNVGGHVPNNKVVTKVRAGDNDPKSPPTIRQIFGIILQSGIKVESIDSNSIRVVDTYEATTKFLKLLDHFLEWKF